VSEPGAPAPALPQESVEELFESGPCGYLSTAPDGLIIRVNQTFLAWTGYAREHLLGKRRFQELLTVPGRIYHETHFAPLLCMQGRATEIAFDLVRADGSTLSVLVSAMQKRDAADAPLLNRIIVFDATDRRAYERELLRARDRSEQLAKGKTELLSMISHDVRTPLSSIMIATQLMDEEGLSAAQRKLLRVIKASSEELLDLTRHLLQASRVESGALLLEQRSFDPRELLQSQLAGIAMRAEDRGLALALEIDEQVPSRLSGDPLKIGQVLANLLGNAVKFTDAGSITLGARVIECRDGGVRLVEFEVRDTGSGIPADRLADIFEAFTQGSYDIGLRHGGVGLGLSICRTLLELHGSRMKVESEPGVGSRFSFRLLLRP
jgi:PAS domain S-box-containing protein